MVGGGFIGIYTGFLLLCYQSFATLRMSGSAKRMSMELFANMLFFIFICFSIFSFALGYRGLYTQSGVEMRKMGHLQMKNLALSEVTNEMDKLKHFVAVIKDKSIDGLQRTCSACSTDDEFSPGHVGPFFRKQVFVATGQFGDQPGSCPGARFLPAPKNVEEMAQLADIMKNNSIRLQPVNNFVLDRVVCLKKNYEPIFLLVVKHFFLVYYLCFP